MADKEPTPADGRNADRKAEEKRQQGIADAVDKSNKEYAKSTITGEGPDGQPTRSVPSAPPPVEDK